MGAVRSSRMVSFCCPVRRPWNGSLLHHRRRSSALRALPPTSWGWYCYYSPAGVKRRVPDHREQRASKAAVAAAAMTATTA